MFWPVAWLSFDWATLTGLYEESLGFRYFYSLRTVHEPQIFLFLAQGHLVTFCHELLQVVLDQFLPAEQLLPRIDVFARLAIALAHGVVLCAFAWALRPVVFDKLRIALAGLWALLYYVDGWDGYYVLLSVDYHAWIPAAGLLFTGLLARAITDDVPLLPIRYLQLGAFAAFAVGVKITLGALAAVAGVYFLILERPLRRARRGILCAVLLAEVLVLLIFCFSFWGHVEYLPRYLLGLAYFLASAIPIDVITADRLRSYIDGGRAFGLVAIVSLPVLLLAFLALARSRAERALGSALLLGAAIYIYFAAQRFTPVTFFEAGVFWLSALSLSVAQASRQRNWVHSIPAAAVMAAIGLGTGANALSATIANLHANDASQGKLRRILDAIPGSVAFMIPANQFQFMSLEGALFKGTSDLASRVETGDTPFAKRLLGERVYLFGERSRYQGNPPEIETYSAIAFTVPYSGEVSRDPAAGIARRLKELEHNYNVPLARFSCDQWVEFEGAAWLAAVCRRGAATGSTGRTR